MLYKLSIAVLLGVLITTSAYAELYKKVDEQGNITYTDVPSGSAKPVQPPGLTTYGAPDVHKQPSKKPADTTTPAVANYTALTIASPANDEALRENSGTVTVKMSLTPPLDTKAGHKIVLMLDQKSGAITQTSEAVLKDVERGAHTLKAQVTDTNGRVLKESPEINFQLHRGNVTARKAGK